MAAPFHSDIDASTRLCAVYGHPIRHSASPAMQNAGLAALGLNWRYLAFDVHPDLLRAALDGAKAMKFAGLNLTLPHKLLALDLADELDQSARQWQAVNTLVFLGRDDGEWRPLADLDPGGIREIKSRGYNTDADAFAESLRESFAIPIAGASVLLLGAGGAGRMAAWRLASDGAAEIYWINRTASKARETARQIQEQFPAARLTVGEYPPGAVDFVINATSLGLRPDDPLPWSASDFQVRRCRAAYDMTYQPAETRLLAEAKAAGRLTANGARMLLLQGAKALELWTGRAAPLETMRQALLEQLYV